jgi:hypothetical protein
VQAITTDGVETGYSPTNTLTIRAARRQASRTRPVLDWWLPTLHAQPSPNVDDELPTVLDVPMIMQHKDTRMLLLETSQESGAHAWDVDHGQLDPSDPADNLVVVGFGGRDGLVVLNDPAVGTYLVPLSFLSQLREFSIVKSETLRGDDYELETFSVTARADEPEISMDSDGDGVVDFDELHRFQTNPNLKDHDDDELHDKEDIRASVHDRRHGYAHGGNGRDFDGDGTPMERDDDADGGGCLDGWEDENKDGKYDQGPSETDNFANDDDPCVVGDFKKVSDWDAPIVLSDGTRDRGEYHERQNTTFSLRPQPDGTLAGRARASFSLESLRFVSTQGDCLMKTWVPHADWNLELRAQSRALPDGSVEITVLPPDAPGPPIPTHSKSECSPTFSQSHTMASPPFWLPPGPYRLVNGVFRLGGTMPTGNQIGTGEVKWELTVEQKGRQQP